MKTVIIGTGGLAKEMRFLLRQINHNSAKFPFFGYIDDDQTKSIHGEKVVGDDEWLLTYKYPINIMFGIGTPTIVTSANGRGAKGGVAIQADCAVVPGCGCGQWIHGNGHRGHG